MALGLTQPLKEMEKARSASKADNLTAICEPTVYKMWALRRLTILWTFTSSYSDSFTFHFYQTQIQATYYSKRKHFNIICKEYLWEFGNVDKPELSDLIKIYQAQISHNALNGTLRVNSCRHDLQDLQIGK
jgi:hypothetical protein